MDSDDIAAPTPNYQANPYFGKDIESQAAPLDIKGPDSLLGHKFVRQRAINWYSSTLYLSPKSSLNLSLQSFLRSCKHLRKV